MSQDMQCVFTFMHLADALSKTSGQIQATHFLSVF